MGSHAKPAGTGKGKKAIKNTGKGIAATARGTVAAGRATKRVWNACLPWPLGCGHSTRAKGCKCCAKHV